MSTRAPFNSPMLAESCSAAFTDSSVKSPFPDMSTYAWRPSFNFVMLSPQRLILLAWSEAEDPMEVMADATKEKTCSGRLPFNMSTVTPTAASCAMAPESPDIAFFAVFWMFLKMASTSASSSPESFAVFWSF